MLSKSVHDIPYYSKQPLSADTAWVAVPISIRAKAKEFKSANNRAQELVMQLPELLQTITSETTSIHLLDYDREFEGLKATMELVSLNDNEFQIRLFQYVIVKFDNKEKFWDKMSHLSNVLDLLYKFSLKHKSDKMLTIKVGSENRILK